jgi:hypothetical protein
MVVVHVKFEFSDPDRELITKFVRERTGEAGVPRLARRRDMERFVRVAVGALLTEVIRSHDPMPAFRETVASVADGPTVDGVDPAVQAASGPNHSEADS